MGGSSNTADDSDSTTVWKEYSDNNISIKYPKDWEENMINSNNEGSIAIISKNVADTTDALASDGKLTSSETNYLPLVYIRNQVVGESETIPSFDEFYNQVETQFQDFNEASGVSLKEITINGHRAIEAVIIGPVSPIGIEDSTNYPDNIKMKVIVIPNYEDKTIHEIVYYTTIGKYNEKIELFNEMVNSIKI